jgi:nucleoside-diphosphate-sugar epimerase
MRILIIGGTHFLGRHLVESALSRSHDVTLFNRGKSIPVSSLNWKQSSVIAKRM